MKDYKETLNLPRTRFPMRGNLPRREPQRLKKWQEADLYRKWVEKREKTGKYFIIHDGPPYSNDAIHLGHALNKIVKDFINKYKALKGYATPFIPGWDNHGMPIEHRVTKQDPEISKILEDPHALKDPRIREKIRIKCRREAEKWIKVQREQFIRLGILADWDNYYYTMASSYESKETEIFADIVEKGFVYRGFMPIHWCPHCQTALAMAEVEYKTKESPSLWFLLKVKDDKKGIFDGKEGYALVWTTTPWTIISNVALAFNPTFDYVVVEVDGNRYLLAEGLLESNAKTLGWENYSVVKKVKGAEIEGTVFEHPFFERDSVAILADFVTLEDGTGIVHIAPGHGKEDFEVGREYGLPIISPVDETGHFTEEAGEMFAGLDTNQASDKVVQVLKERNRFMHLGTITHEYPHCWRCKSPLIFRATEQWFLNVDHNDLRKKALDEIDNNVVWIPPTTQVTMHNAVEFRPDWVLSRHRAWGVNIPAVRCKNCGEIILDPIVIRNAAKIFAEENSDAWYTHPVEDFLPEGFKCPKCGGEEFEKEYDVLDVWFDSGASSLVLEQTHNMPWPTDIYLEGLDQFRGWYNSALMVAVAERGKAPYRIVVTHGWTLDEEGRPMHKSLGNVVDPVRVADVNGADVLRLWVASTNFTQDVRLGEHILAQVADNYRKIRNTIRFMLGNLSDFDPSKDQVPINEMMPVDRFMLHRLEEVKEQVTAFNEAYEFHKGFYNMFKFMVIELSGFYLDITKDRLYTWGKNSKGRRSAQTAIFQILRELLIMLSPLISFTADEAWEHLPGDKEEFVFLEDWPAPVDERRDEELAADFNRLLQVRDTVLVAIEKARKEANILSDRLEARVEIFTEDQKLKQVLQKYRDQLYEIFIVSQQVDIVDVRPDLPIVVEGEGYVVGVDHARGQKCARCWLWSEDIDEDGLCPKCRVALGKE